MIDTFLFEEIAVALPLIATLVGIITRRLRMPYSAGLVTVGAVLAITYRPFGFEIAPQLFLGIFVPPLVFEAAFRLPLRDLRQVRAVAVKAGYAHLKDAHDEGMISGHVRTILSDALDPYLRGLTGSIYNMLKGHPDVEAEGLDSAWREFLRYQRAALSDLHNDHTVSDDAYGEFSSQVDEMLAAPEITWDDTRGLIDPLWSIHSEAEPREPDAEP